MEFCIHMTGRVTPDMFRVAAVPAVYAGTWDETACDILKPDVAAVRAGLPYRFRKAFDRASGFWFDKGSRFDGNRFSGETPHMTLSDWRGRYMGTVYALPCSEVRP